MNKCLNKYGKKCSHRFVCWQDMCLQKRLFSARIRAGPVRGGARPVEGISRAFRAVTGDTILSWPRAMNVFVGDQGIDTLKPDSGDVVYVV